ncbi:Gfo/Idh/MocA family oxidoreductase [Vibrio sp. B1FLJ16]|uniref:Gfo/Idh/MocA family oxidoreductase n=1 Tax=Vibrio sp. B1FLJ16 TaxID=2751178 RepID=UPI0015F437D0|nr:Gfo/Idh/MocA family oxidoreductase [Vibrio sp. B1FLJ16]CAD7817822.1 4-carboxy-2-hydroxymuconate-6-semialdehyde dehydrogenase [Vibrio sp. B1FLJ16]CAE6932389.1 4-carboxy-2-hydroxymuconate-6-semialdehyde dehydrogenase [Vibrio sp. B1FLJ16]
MNICVVGATGAFGNKHLDALKQINDVTVTALVGAEADKMAVLGEQYPNAAICHSLSEALQLDTVEAVILATPTQLHASQGIECLEAGKHVLVEIPMADNIEDSRRLVETQQRTGLIAMAGHTRRFNPSHQWIHNKIKAGELHIQQMDVQTYFFRRTNTNAKGEPRTWTDHLLWHHACHTVDLFQYQTGEESSQLQALQGPIHPELGIAMDMSIGMKVPSGAICTLSLSFNNDGPLGTFFRYICEEGTYIARYDDLFDGYDNQIDLSDVAISNNGIELIDREFISAIKEAREPNSSVAQCLGAMETLHKLEQLLESK